MSVSHVSPIKLMVWLTVDLAIKGKREITPFILKRLTFFYAHALVHKGEGLQLQKAPLLTEKAFAGTILETSPRAPHVDEFGHVHECVHIHTSSIQYGGDNGL